MLGGILLTGGMSRRMGRDKATLSIGATTLSMRTAHLLNTVTSLAVEVGEGVTSLPATCETPRGGGPLAAIVAGHSALLDMGLRRDAACLVLACDLPLLSISVLEKIAEWPTTQSVLPVIDLIPQPLCAKWSANDLFAAVQALSNGERSLRHFPDRERATCPDETEWGVDCSVFSDVDYPEDLKKLSSLHNVKVGEPWPRSLTEHLENQVKEGP